MLWIWGLPLHAALGPWHIRCQRDPVGTAALLPDSFSPGSTQGGSPPLDLQVGDAGGTPAPHPQLMHLRVARGWSWVERCGHQPTQQQLVHLRVLQQHQFQQVWRAGRKGEFSRPTPGLPLPTAPLPGPYLPRPQRPAQDRAGGRCSEGAQRMYEAEWGTKAGEPGVSPSFNPPGCGVGGGTAHATGCRTVTQRWGRGRLSSARPARDRTKFSPHPAPVHSASGLAPPGLVLLPARTDSRFPESPGRLESRSAPTPLPPGFCPSGDGSPVSQPPRPPSKSRLSPHRRGGTLRWGLTPAPSSAGGHAGTCGSGLPGRPGRRQSLFPRMRRSLPGAGAPLLSSPWRRGGGEQGVPEDSLPQEAAPSADVHLQHPCAAAELPGPAAPSTRAHFRDQVNE